MVLAILWMVLGAGAFSFAIGNLSSLLANFDSDESKLALKIEQLVEFCKEAKINDKLRSDLKESIEYVSRKGMFSWVDKQKIFSELPPQIKSEVARQMYGGMVNKFRFFRNKDSTFISLVVPLLQASKVAIAERICTKNDHPTASIIFYLKVVYFLLEGKVVFVLKDRIAFKAMLKGTYFGEADILAQRRRQYTVRALVDSHILTLSKQIFETLVMPEYPEIIEEMRKVANERDQRFADSKKLMKNFLKKKMVNLSTIFDNNDEGMRIKRILSKMRYDRSNDRFELNGSADYNSVIEEPSMNKEITTEQILDAKDKGNKKDNETTLNNITIDKLITNSPRGLFNRRDDDNDPMTIIEEIKDYDFQDQSSSLHPDSTKYKLLKIKKEIKESNAKQKVTLLFIIDLSREVK